MHHLGQPFENDENRDVVVALLVRRQSQSGHKVYGEVFLPMSWYRQGLQVTIGLMSDHLQSQTNITSLDIALDVSFQAWLIVFPANQLSCLISTKMPYRKIIMITTYHFRTDDF